MNNILRVVIIVFLELTILLLWVLGVNWIIENQPPWAVNGIEWILVFGLGLIMVVVLNVFDRWPR